MFCFTALNFFFDQCIFFIMFHLSMCSLFWFLFTCFVIILYLRHQVDAGIVLFIWYYAKYSFKFYWTELFRLDVASSSKASSPSSYAVLLHYLINALNKLVKIWNSYLDFLNNFYLNVSGLELFSAINSKKLRKINEGFNTRVWSMAYCAIFIAFLREILILIRYFCAPVISTMCGMVLNFDCNRFRKQFTAEKS